MKLKFILTSFVCLLFKLSFAGIETYTNRIEGSNISVNNTYTTFDEKYWDMALGGSWASEFTNYKVNNKVRLGINSSVSQTSTYSGTVGVEIIYKKLVGGVFQDVVINRTLTVGYNTNGTSIIDDQSTAVFTDGHQVKVKVTSISGLTNTNIYLETEIEVERYYAFDGAAVQGAIVVVGGTSSEFLDFSWNTKKGAEFYEVEWVHINDYTLQSGVYKSTSSLPYNYYLNSTRVETKSSNYRIPRMFDHGYVIYRVRAVGKGGSGFTQRVDGAWSAAESGTVATHPSSQRYADTTEYDAGMNWSYQAGYTEGSKRMDGVSFSDGLGRGRQSVGTNAETGQVIVSNVYYDAMGRPAVSDLPTPVDNDRLRHMPNFNRANVAGDSTYYNKFFDMPGTVCDQYVSQGFSKDYGAGKYYSENNPNKQGANANIPNAERYPFTRITYLNDFTGRVDRTSAAGDTLSLGKGHNTRMVYPSSNQTELNMLFGVEVGEASHYQKLITIDANGQVYNQYLDMAGRTIASFMEGHAPSNLEALPNTLIDTSKVVMLKPGGAQNINSAPSSILTYHQYIAMTGPYVFEYSVTPEQYMMGCMAEGICLDCVYDLEILVLDECGLEKKKVTHTINGTDLNGSCITAVQQIDTFSLTLTPGLYSISKKLSVNQDALTKYWCYYINDNTCLDPLSTIFDSLYTNEPFENCTTPVEMDDNQDHSCEYLKNIMLLDMKPGGQYGAYTNTNGVYSSSSLWSVYTPSPSLNGNWQSPTTPYLDENGDTVTYFVTHQGANYNERLTYFIAHFRDEWAEGLLEYHPEYCYLYFCEHNSDSQEYDNLLRDTDEFETALSLGYFKPLGVIDPSYLEGSGMPYDGANSALDPFFQNMGSGYASDMESYMAQYISIVDPGTSVTYNLSMWEYALFQTLDCGGSPDMAKCLESYDEDPCMMDQVWVIFRELYLEAKQLYVFQAQQEYATTNNCSNSCIGAETPCSGPQGALADYIPRWGNENQYTSMINDMSTESGAQAFVDALVESTCENSCANFADQWISELSGCNFSSLSSTDLGNLRNDLILVCKEGCDSEHPIGSTTTPSGITVGNNYSSIGDVLEYYLGSGYEDYKCSELLISAPGPYRETDDLIEIMVQPLDTCACNLLYEAQTAYEIALANESLPEGVHNIETMLAYGWQIEMDDVNALMCSCDQYRSGNNWQNGANESLVSENILIPANITCSSKVNCQSCETVQTDLQILAQRFAVADYEEFSQLPNHETILTNFLNNTYNFDLDAPDYLTFINGCNASNGEPYCTVNPQMQELSEIATVLALRGKLTSTSSFDLTTNNIVYAYGELKEQGLGNAYSASIVSNTLTMNFSGAEGNCTTTLTLPVSPEFGFDDIISFGTVYPLTENCGDNNTFKVEVGYYSCGSLQTAFLMGSSDCLAVTECVCGDDGQLLCYDPFEELYSACYQPRLDELIQTAQEQYEANIAAQYDIFKAEYNNKCDNAFSNERFELEGKFKRYQYTLYYYDQAGNLVKTIAPDGVTPLSDNYSDAIDTDRDGVLSSANYPAVTAFNKPGHTYQTGYKYNSYNQLVSTTNPDQDGETKFWYDRYGRIAASQNPVQAQVNKYSYTFYDAQGRPVEVGQVVKTSAPSEPDLKTDDLAALFKTWVNAGTKSEVTITTYDKFLSSTISAKFANGQQFLRLRVATVAYFETVTGGTNFQTDYTSAIHYSYDIHGNVVETLQDVPMLAPVQQDVKSTQYEFELVSGNVKKVHYQKGKADATTHEYEYDRMNRLTEVFTSHDAGVHISRQAHYFYYDYGPVARVELGQHKVQGMDFTYTINGWMKGMNSSLLNNSYDMGRDGRTGYLTNNSDIHELHAKDVVSYTLGYFNGDYTAIDATSQMEANYYTAPNHSAFSTAANSLYNGNIRSLVSSIYNMTTLGTAYKYDQLNRLKTMSAFYYNGNPLSTNTWSTSISTTDYYTRLAYYKNGNIDSLQRNGIASQSVDMDSLKYQYDDPVNGGNNNRLTHVDDAVASAYTDDIEDQGAANYVYDKIGQLTADGQEGITMAWRYGDKKLKTITKSQANESDVEFIYNPFGQRVVKIEMTRTGSTINSQDQWVYTYYAYDANGQVMTVYDVRLSGTLNKAIVDEENIYGASRLGMRNSGRVLYNNGAVSYPSLDIYQNTLGKVSYEITNYLGNVNAVISDRKTWNGGGYYEAVVIITADYYPGGMTMPGRNTSAGTYRYGYNGMEGDPEVKGQGNSYTTKFRQNDPRLGRWWSIDPKPEAGVSPYCSMDNNPIKYNDVLGLYTEKRAKRMAEKAEKQGYTASYKQTDGGGKNDWHLIVGKEKEDKTGYYSRRMVHGRFRGFEEKNFTSYDEIYKEFLGEDKGSSNQLNNSRYIYDKGAMACHSPAGSYHETMVRSGWFAFGDACMMAGFHFATAGFGDVAIESLMGLRMSSSAGEGSKYLYHYTSPTSANNISKVGLNTEYSADGFIYLTNKGNLSPLQAQIELALPANRSLPTSILRVDASGLTPSFIRNVQGNLPGMGAGGGTEFLYNQGIPAHLIKIIK